MAYLMLRSGLFALSLAVSSTVAHAAYDPVKELTGRSLSTHIKRAADRTGNSISKFMHNPIDYTLERPVKILAQVCSTPAQTYETLLRGRSRSWHTLPSELIDAVQPAYKVDLSEIRFATSAPTANGQAQTFGDTIYFPRKIDLRNRDDLRWMLHELEHSVQFANATYGKSGKLCEYVFKSVGTGFQHDSIDMERAADRKADALIDYAYAAMTGELMPFLLKMGLAPDELYISNDTDRAVVFSLETDNTRWTKHRLEAGSASIFAAERGDNRWNLSINTDGTEIRYTVPGGTRQAINYNPRGKLDFYHDQRPVGPRRGREWIASAPAPTPTPPPTSASSICLFTAGPLAGRKVDYSYLGYRLPLGHPCVDGLMSSGVIVAN